jgi:2-hydroxychromene-2-carboxylate isomerase
MWADQKNMSDGDVVAGALHEAGLDGSRLIARAQEPEVKERLLKNTEASVARGTFGSPTFFVGDEIFFGKDKLRDVEQEIARARG